MIMRKEGFTVLEILLYLGLFSMIICGALGATVALFQASEHTKKALQIQEEMLFISRKINWELTNAQSATASSPDSLKLEPGNIVIRGEMDTLTISRGSGAHVPLASTAYRVSDVQFSVTSAAGGTNTVAVHLTVDGKPLSFKKHLLQ